MQRCVPHPSSRTYRLELDRLNMGRGVWALYYKDPFHTMVNVSQLQPVPIRHAATAARPLQLSR